MRTRALHVRCVQKCGPDGGKRFLIVSTGSKIGWHFERSRGGGAARSPPRLTHVLCRGGEQKSSSGGWRGGFDRSLRAASVRDPRSAVPDPSSSKTPPLDMKRRAQSQRGILHERGARGADTRRGILAQGTPRTKACCNLSNLVVTRCGCVYVFVFVCVVLQGVQSSMVMGKGSQVIRRSIPPARLASCPSPAPASTLPSPPFPSPIPPLCRELTLFVVSLQTQVHAAQSFSHLWQNVHESRAGPAWGGSGGGCLMSECFQNMQKYQVLCPSPRLPVTTDASRALEIPPPRIR